MEQSYNLKQNGNYSLFEQENMTAEERNWTIKRINKQREDEKAAAEKARRK